MNNCPITSFPKIWSLGSPEVEDLFKGTVEVTEKVDGSQFAFGQINGDLVVRSKGKQMYPESCEKLFKKAVDHVVHLNNLGLLHPDMTYYGEAVTSPKHNTLKYERVPKGFIALYGAKYEGKYNCTYAELCTFAKILMVDVVPLLHLGEINDKKDLDLLLAHDSFLGNEKIEGVVIKNHGQLAKSAFSRECFAKLVRPEFKERHSHNPAFAKKKDRLDDFLAQFQTEARWIKAISRLRDQGNLEYAPKDIGKLIVEVQKDIVEEEENYIKEALYQMYKKQIVGRAVIGLPEYYKKYLVEKQFHVQ